MAPGEWVRASDGNVRVMGQGGISLNRSENAIPFNSGFSYPEEGKTISQSVSNTIENQGVNRANFVRALALPAGRSIQDNKSTSFNAASVPAEASDPWTGSASIPQTQAQPPQTPPRQPRRERPRAPGGALAQINAGAMATQVVHALQKIGD